jgi:cytoskeleton protein RodZ
MVDNPDDSRQQTAVEPRAGQRLANARRANNISMRDIAKELHLDEVKVQALEDNRFEVLGAPVFAKGYLRKYAELLSVPIDDVLADYYRLNRAVGAPPVVGPKRQRPHAELSPGRWIAGIVILLVAAAAAYWWLSRPPAPAGVTLTRSAPPPLESEPASAQSMSPAENGSVTLPVPVPVSSAADADAQSSVAADAEAAATQPAETSAVDAELPAVVSSSAQSPAETDSTGDLAAGSAYAAELQLQLSFSGDCWTEVTDSNGRRLYFGLGTDGRNVTVSGVPPLRVLLGNNDNVSLLVNGQVYTVQGSELRGNTARLTIVGS